MTALTEIRLVVFDFDGVFSDNRVWTNDRGEESVACTRADTVGLRRLDDVGVDYLIITSETNDAVPARARKMRIECIRGIEDKLPVLREQLERRVEHERVGGLHLGDGDDSGDRGEELFVGTRVEVAGRVLGGDVGRVDPEAVVRRGGGVRHAVHPKTST